MPSPGSQTKSLTLEETIELAKPEDGPRQTLPSRTEVLIVGAGPVGLTALLMLETLGVQCALIERNSTTSALPKAIAIDDEFTRLLSNLGLEDKILETSSFPFGIHFKSHTDRDLIRVDAFQTPNGFGNRVAVSQPVLEKLLLGRPPAATSTVRYGACVTGLTSSDGEVSVDYQDEDGSRHAVSASYVLACDGARSAVRDLIGIDFPGRRIDEPHLVIDLADFPDQTPASRFFCNPRRPLNSIPGPFGGRRLEFMLNPDDDREFLLTDAGIRWIVDEFSPYRGVPLKIIRRAIYGFSARVADQFKKARVFLLGDAAHVMPPFGGQGLNTGARDVANLGWKLALVIGNKASPDILNTYDAERRGQVARIVRYSVAVGTLTNIRSRLLSGLRDMTIHTINLYPPIRNYLASMRYMPRPSMESGLLLDAGKKSSEVVGKIFPRLRLRGHDGRAGPVDEWIGFRHALLLFDASEPEMDQASSLATRESPPLFVANIVSARSPLADGSTLICDDARSEEWLMAHSKHCLLIRPDRYIAARGLNGVCQELMASYQALLRSSSASVSAGHAAGPDRAGGTDPTSVKAGNLGSR